jgi:hypothetical protein
MEHLYNVVKVLFSVIGPVLLLFCVCFTLTSIVNWYDKQKYENYIPTAEKDGHSLTESHGSIKVRR